METTTDEKKTMTKTQREKLIQLAKARLTRGLDTDRHNRAAAVDDLKFGSLGEQWDEKEAQRRKLFDRPCLRVNLMPKFFNTVVGDGRKNRPSVKVRPEDSKASVDIANIRAGIIRNIEYASNAEAIYDYALDMVARCGYGAWRVLTRYTRENPFLQEIFLERLRNPFTVIMDPDCKSEVYADARWGFVIEKMQKSEFEDKYPKAIVPGAELLESSTGLNEWGDSENVVVAEYYYIEEEEVEYVMTTDGEILTRENFDKKVRNFKARRDERLAVPEEEDSTTVTRNKIKHVIMTAAEILEGPDDVVGDFIPLVLVTGREYDVEGKRYVESLIRNGKDPQRLFNYWITSSAELIALAPKSPWVGTEKHFEGYENDYARAHVDNLPMLKYNIDPDNPDSKPERQPAPPVPVAIFQETANAKEALKDAIGMFNVDLGAPAIGGREITGAAVRARRAPGESGTFCFVDNLARAVAHSGRIINSMIPHIYDTERDVRVRNMDASERMVPINTTAAAAQKKIQSDPLRFGGEGVAESLGKHIEKFGSQSEYNSISSGTYGVVITSGPSYATLREEAGEKLMEIIRAYPNLITVAGDLVMENQDFLGANEIAERIRATMPEEVAPMREGERPRKQPPIPPEVQVQMLKLEMGKMQLELQKLKMVKEMQDTKGAVKGTLIEMMKEIFADKSALDGSPRGT